MSIEFGLLILKVHDVKKRVVQLAQAGYASCNLNSHTALETLDMSDEALAQWSECLAHNEMKLFSVHAPFGSGQHNPSHPDAAVRQQTLDTYSRCLEQTGKLGAQCMVVHPGGTRNPETRDQELEDLYRSLDALLPVAERTGVRLALENIVGHQSTHTGVALRSVVDHFDSDYLGVCFDTGHAHLVEDVCDAFTATKEKIIAFHLQDNDGTGDQHLIPGEGTIAWRQLAPMILDARLDFPYCVEAPLKEIDDPLHTALLVKQMFSAKRDA